MPDYKKLLEILSGLSFSNGAKLIDNISDIITRDNNIGFTIYITDNTQLEEAESLRSKANSLLCKHLDGAIRVNIAISNKEPHSKQQTRPVKHTLPAHKVVAVSSGKGGVGKSTIAALIAQQLSSAGYKVGLLDADIYGPSIPTLFGVREKPLVIDNKFQPILLGNIKLMSMGFLVEPDKALSLRGPMITKSLDQLLRATNWADETILDYLIIDTPPGTGDIHISLLQNYHIDGVIIVTTPQQLAVIDTIRTIDLYNKLNTKILGIVENMSYLVTSGGNQYPFGQGGAEKIAQKYKLEIIAQLPLLLQIAEAQPSHDHLARIYPTLIFK